MGFCAAAALAQPLPAVRQLDLDGQVLSYQVREGWAVTHGDILLGRASELEGGRLPGRARQAALIVFGVRPALWPGGTMYYSVDPDVPDPQRIEAAAAEWNARTPLRVLPRGAEPNYVRFQRVGPTMTCSSYLGMLGGEQIITVPDSCPAGSLAHEIGHAFGMLHEQERGDRNRYVTVLLEQIDKRYQNNFDQIPASTRDIAYYDFDSIMHYSASGFTTQAGADSLETVPVGIPIGQRARLSPGDIDAISRAYGLIPEQTTITTVPMGLPIVVDGVEAVSPQSYAWAPGSAHRIAVAPEIGAGPVYRLVYWSDGGEASHEIVASSERTVFAAVFQRWQPATIRTGSGGGTASLAPFGPALYPERMPLLLRAAPTPNEVFLSWSGRPNVQNSGFGLASEVVRTQPGGNGVDLAANFTAAPTTIVLSEPPGVIIQVDGVSYRTPARFAFVAGTQHTLAAAAQTGTGGVSAFTFLDWSDGGAATHAITAGAGSATLTARFQRRFLLSTSVAGSGRILVNPPSPDGFYDEGTEVELTAQPDPGNALRLWLGDLAGGGATRTIRMDGQRRVVARFGPALAFSTFNAASFQIHPLPSRTTAAVAPGEIVTVFSDREIGPAGLATAQVVNGRLTTSLAGTRVLFDGVPAPLVYVARNQLSAVVPAAVAGRAFTVMQIERDGAVVATESQFVEPTFPSIFTSDASGVGQIAAFNQDFSLNSGNNGAAPGSVLILYATGAGLPERDVPDGQVMGAELVPPRAPVFVRLGKLPAQVLYAGSAPGLVSGVLQVNVLVPPEALPDPATPIQLIVGDYASPPGATVAIR
jgi:uncharacterized protein (TIGR03437 family)